MGIERFIHQRVMDVIAARDVLDAARQQAQDANELVAKQTIEVKERRRYVADLQTADGQLAQGTPHRRQCHGIWKGKPDHLRLPEQSGQRRDSETAAEGSGGVRPPASPTAQASLTEAEDSAQKAPVG